MGMIANLVTLWKNRKNIQAVSNEVKQVKEVYVKSGWKSSEFWLTALSVLATLSETFKGNIDPKWGAIISAGITLGYAVVRGLTKAAAVGQTTTTEAK